MVDSLGCAFFIKCLDFDCFRLDLDLDFLLGILTYTF